MSRCQHVLAKFLYFFVPSLIPDAKDAAILRALQRNGRLTNVEMAAEVHLSPSSCLRRVQKLEQDGLIEGYVAILNQTVADKPGTVFVQVTLDSQQQEYLHAFEEGVRAFDDVMDCHLMAGDADYILRVIVADASDYERIHEHLTRLPGVSRVKSAFALRTVKRTTQLPLHSPARA